MHSGLKFFVLHFHRALHLIDFLQAVVTLSLISICRVLLKIFSRKQLLLSLGVKRIRPDTSTHIVSSSLDTTVSLFHLSLLHQFHISVYLWDSNRTLTSVSQSFPGLVLTFFLVSIDDSLPTYASLHMWMLLTASIYVLVVCQFVMSIEIYSLKWFMYNGITFLGDCGRLRRSCWR